MFIEADLGATLTELLSKVDPNVMAMLATVLAMAFAPVIIFLLIFFVISIFS